MLRPTVSLPVCLGVKPHLGPKTRYLLVRQLRVCLGEAPFLTRRRVCRLQLLLVFPSAVILGSEFPGIQDSPNLDGQVPIIPPGTGFSFRRLLRLAGLRWRYSNPPPHCVINKEILISTIHLLSFDATRTQRKRRLQQFFVVVGTSSPSCYLATKGGHTQTDPHSHLIRHGPQRK
jgi:hypothetical protein